MLILVMGRISASAYRNIRIKIHIRIRIEKGADADVSSSFMMIGLLNKYETIGVQTYLSEHFLEGIVEKLQLKLQQNVENYV